MTIQAYYNSSDAIVIPDCPCGEHSHFLVPEGSNYEETVVDENGDGTYICPCPQSDGQEIQFHVS